jgi:nucleotide-binding universal stress UspA family protein
MTLLQRIVCAVDFSDPSFVALDIAAQWSRKLDRSLTVAHIFDPAPVGPSSALPYPAWPTLAASKAIERDARTELTRLAAEKLADVPHNIEVTSHTSPSLGICGCAGPADLIIVGTQGKTGLKRVLMGSVAEQTIRYAPCPVLVVRGDIEPETFPKSMMVCTDFSEESMPALALGGAVASAFNTSSTMVHTRTEHSRRQQLEWAESSGAEEVDSAVRKELERLHSAYLPPPVQEAFVVADSVSDAIVRHAAQAKTDLIVLATHGRTGLKRLAMGSVAEHVTRHAPCSVLVARTHAIEAA